jgi:preprotein translocase subunit YajC
VNPGSLLFVLVPIAFLFLLFNGQRKRQRQAAALQEQVTVGSTICMTSGLFGRVVSLTDSEVVIEAAPGVNLRYDRRAVGLVVPSSGTSTDATAQPTADADPSADPPTNIPTDLGTEPGTSGETGGHDKPS